MSVREASQFQTLYPTRTFEPEKKAKLRSGSQSESESQSQAQQDGASASAPRMDSRRALTTRVPPNPRKKNASEVAGSAFASTEPRQVAISASSTSSTSSTSSISSTSSTPSSSSSTSAARSVAPANEFAAPAANKPIIFNRDEKVSNYVTGDDIKSMLTARVNVELVNQQVNELIDLYRIRKEDPAKLRAGESPFVTVGKQILANYQPTHFGPTISDVAACLWLVGATLASEGDKLKQFFDLALAFREKGIDLSSMIVNEAIAKRNIAFLSRLHEIYPNTNLDEVYRTKF